MFKIHLGSTPNTLAAEDWGELGRLTEGLSGSDISVMVRQALMEPLRKCRTAKYFKKDVAGKYFPIMLDPPCARCPPDLASSPVPTFTPCAHCGCERVGLFDMDSTALRVPDVTMEDFLAVVDSSKASVATEELRRFEDWTVEFGEEGA
jgi:vacuolar protein-sorting-associated protein 4